MSIYEGYAVRERIGAGVAIKRRQAQAIFELGLKFSRGAAGGVVEIGPGDGYVAELARSANLDYCAVEGSEAVANAIERKGFRVVRGYVPPLPASLASGYRCCCLLHVLEHMKTPVEAAEVVCAIHDRLAPGGTIVVACPDYSRWGHYFYDCDYTHAYPVTRRRLDRLLRDHGFEPVYHTVYVGPVFGYAGMPISWLAKLLYWPFMDDLVGPKHLKDVLNRGFVTFLPNILTIARRLSK